MPLVCVYAVHVYAVCVCVCVCACACVRAVLQDSQSALLAAYTEGRQRLAKLVHVLSAVPPALPPGRISLELNQRPASPGVSNMTKVHCMLGGQEGGGA